MVCFHSKGETQGKKKTRIWRINLKTGFYEEIIYCGDLRNKPKGWYIKI